MQHLTSAVNKACGAIYPQLDKAQSLDGNKYFEIAKQVALYVPSAFLLLRHPVVTVLSAAAGLGLRACALSGENGEALVETIKDLWRNQSFQVFTLIGLIALSCVLPTLSLTILTMANGFRGADSFLSRKENSDVSENSENVSGEEDPMQIDEGSQQSTPPVVLSSALESE